MHVPRFPALPIRLGDVLQTAIVVRDLRKTMEAYWRLFGIGPWNIYEYAPPMLRDCTVRGTRVDYSMRLALAKAGPTQLELIQPLEGPSIYWEFLEQKGEGLHHVQSNVENLEAVLAACREAGIAVLMSGRFGEGEFYYLDTEALLGFTYEVVRRKSRPAPHATYP